MNYFQAICPEFDFSDETIQKIAGIMDTNKKEIRLAYADVEVSITGFIDNNNIDFIELLMLST